MAANPQYRLRFSTDRSLLALASSISLLPARNCTVFYAEDHGAALASIFVTKHPRHTRLDDLLQRTSTGQKLWRELTSRGRPWATCEEIWWELSWRLARAAKGEVNVFGPDRLVSDQPLASFRHKYSTGSYANTVFEKVELPELEANPHVSAIFYNGQRFE